MPIQDLQSIALIISIGAFLVSIVTFIINYYRGRKTEQMKLSIEISSKLDEAEKKMIEKEDESKEMIIDVHKANAVQRSLRQARELYLNHWEFFHFW
jgi:regulator of sigma D